MSSSLKESVIKQNISFIYGRPQATAIPDPDKAAVVRSTKYIEEDVIETFEGEFEFLSPFHRCPVFLPGDSLPYPTIEHALQASKMSDQAKREILRGTENIREMKKIASKLVQDSTWKQRAPAVAESILRDKFLRNKNERTKLLATGRRTLKYKNSYGDMFWGIDEGRNGQNVLGKLLEHTRDKAERGSDLVAWIKEYFKPMDTDKILISLVTTKDGEIVNRRTFNEKSVLYLGKAEDCDVVAENPSVSRKHAVVIADSNRGLVIIDLNTSNGTIVGGTKIEGFQPVALTSETLVRLGTSSKLLQFTLDTSVAERRSQQLYAKLANADPPEGAEGPRRQGVQENTAFVGNIPYTVLEAELRSFFEVCGSIKSFSIPKDKATGELKGIAFVEFATIGGLHQALMRDGDELGGRPLKITRQQQQKPSGAGEGKPNSSSRTDTDSKPSHYMRQAASSVEGSQIIAPIKASVDETRYPDNRRSRSKSRENNRSRDRRASSRSRSPGKRQAQRADDSRRGHNSARERRSRSRDSDLNRRRKESNQQGTEDRTPPRKERHRRENNSNDKKKSKKRSRSRSRSNESSRSSGHYSRDDREHRKSRK